MAVTLSLALKLMIKRLGNQPTEVPSSSGDNMDLSNHLDFLVKAVISLKGSRTKSLDPDVNFHKMQGTEEHFEQQCKCKICPVRAQAGSTHHIPASSTDCRDLRDIEEGFTSGTQNLKMYQVFVYLVLNLDPPA